MEQFKGRLLTTWPVMTEAWHLAHPSARLRLMEWAGKGGVIVFDRAKMRSKVSPRSSTNIRTGRWILLTPRSCYSLS